MTKISNTCLICFTFFVAAANAADPLDTATKVSPVRYESPFSNYRSITTDVLLPWQKLFTTEGEFNDGKPSSMELQVRKPSASHSDHSHQENSDRRNLPSPSGRGVGGEGNGHGASTLVFQSNRHDRSSEGKSVSTASDARGVVQTINKAENKIKLKHGPIEKLDMPGMTMVFRVTNPQLLEQVKEGEEIGFTIEKQGSAYVITGFQK